MTVTISQVVKCLQLKLKDHTDVQGQLHVVLFSEWTKNNIFPSSFGVRFTRDGPDALFSPSPVNDGQLDIPDVVDAVLMLF